MNHNPISRQFLVSIQQSITTLSPQAAGAPSCISSCGRGPSRVWQGRDLLGSESQGFFTGSMSRHRSSTWVQVLSTMSRLFILDLVQEREGGEQSIADRRSVAGRTSWCLRAPWRRWRRGSRSRRGADPAVAVDDVDPGALQASTGTDRRRGWRRRTSWWRQRSFPSASR